MTFLDDLTLVLDLLILVTVSVFYTGVTVWFEMSRNDGPRARAHLRQGGLMAGILGALMMLIALWGEFTWPLSLVINGSNVLAAYDLLFFDALMMLSLLLVGFAIAVSLRLPTSPVGVLGIVIGAGIMYYGYRGYTLSLTKDPLETLLMYLAFGAVAIMSYPVTLFIDQYVVGPAHPESSPMPADPKMSYPMLWMAVNALFLVFVVLAGAAAVAYGFSTAWAHLAAPP